MQDFRNLLVWQRAHELVLTIYQDTAAFPREERFGLISQLRRSAASIAANIAEGCGRGSKKDMARFIQIAMGSASETEYHLLLAHDLNFINETAYYHRINNLTEIKRMLTGLLKKLKLTTDS